jgi:hypothetical protein
MGVEVGARVFVPVHYTQNARPLNFLKLSKASFSNEN